MTVTIKGIISTIPLTPPANPPSSPKLVYTISGSDSFYPGDGQAAACCSSDGKCIYVCSTYQAGSLFYVYCNTNYGNSANWSKSTVTYLNGLQAQQICCSSNGQYIYVLGTGGLTLAGSSNFGSSWVSITRPNTSMQSITCNTAGTILFVSLYGVAGTGVYTSTNISTSMTTPTWSLSYATSLGQVLGQTLNADSTILYEYRYNYSGTNWYGAYIPVTAPTTLGTLSSYLFSNTATGSGYNSTSMTGAISNDGTKYATGTYTSSYMGFIYSLDSGKTFNIYNDSGVTSVAMSGDGKYWITTGTSGIKYNQTGFLDKKLIQGPNTVTTFKFIIVARSANYYFAFTTTQIYIGSYY